MVWRVLAHSLDIMEEHEEFKKKMLKYQNNMLDRELVFPLDYHLCLPKELRESRDNRQQYGTVVRENAFKNVGMVPVG